MIKNLKKYFKKIFRIFRGVLQLIEIRRSKKIKLLDFNIQKIKIEIESGDLCFNFSAAYVQSEQYYVGVARQFIDSKDIFYEAKVYIGRLDRFDEIIQLNELNDTILRLEIIGYVRLEDLRVFTINDNIFALCVCICKSNKNLNCTELCAKQVLICIKNEKILSFKILETGLPIEKNWTLLNIENDNACLVYSLVPFQIIGLQISMDKAIDFFDVKTIESLELRNSTNFIQIGNIKLGIGHSTIDLGFRYAYLHFFIKIYTNGEVFTSKPYIFNEFSNEFAMSLLKDNNEKYVILFSNHDKGNYRASFDPLNLEKINWLKLSI
jgi:hypothetical protein